MFADVTKAGAPAIDAVANALEVVTGAIVATGPGLGAAEVPPPPPQPANSDETISPKTSDVFFMRAVSERDMKRG